MFIKNGPCLTKWKPKKWLPEYEKMVILSVSGKSGVQIARELGYTPVHVSNVLNLEEAERLRDALILKMRERAEIDIPAGLAYIAGKTIERLKMIMDSDELFEKSPFAVIDRGMDVVKGLKHLSGGGNGAPPIGVANQQNNFFIAPAQSKNFLDGMDKADEVKKLYGT